MRYVLRYKGLQKKKMWITEGYGDPPRTYNINSAKLFWDKRTALREAKRLIKRNDFRTMDLEAVEIEILEKTEPTDITEQTD